MFTPQLAVPFLLLGCAMLAPRAFAMEPVRTIQVRGEGSATSPPDMATIDAGVASVAPTAAEALKANNQAMASLMSILKEQGIAAKDVQTSHFQVSPEYVPRNQAMELAGYRVSNQVQVRMRDLPNVGKLLDALVRSGSNQVSGVRFGIDNEQGIQDQSRTRAIQEARRRAELYASAAGVRVGKVITIEEQPTTTPGPMMMSMVRQAADSVPIATGEQTIQSSVLVRYELQD